MSISRTFTARRRPVDDAPTRRQVSSGHSARGDPRRGTGQLSQELVLERYRLHRRLGTGAFGTVWLARDERLDRDVAVKVLPRERVVGGRFEREARAAARLSHPGIVTLYEATVDDDGAYLVSELVAGSTLGELLEAGRLSDRDVAQIGVALCDALAHAHAHGVVHRDVKPSNILVPDRVSAPAQVAKLTDFGVARVIGGDSLTRTGDVVGTVAYMAPEQAEGRPAGAAADLYSLALVIYEALTGINPLRAGAAARRARRLGAHLPPVRRHRRDLPRDLGRAIDLALRPRPKERGSIEELRQGLASSIGRLDEAPESLPDPAPDVDGPEPELEPFAPRLDAVDPPSVPFHARLLPAAAAAGLSAWLAASQLNAPGPAAAVAAALGAIAVALLLRAGWLALIAVAAIALAIQGRSGAAVLLAGGALLPIALLPTQAVRWPLAMVAPALGAVGLAGAWPALAARAPTAWQRAALGAVGWIWLELGTVLSASALYTGLPDGTPRFGAWSASPAGALREVVKPLLNSGALTPALVWAAAALLLPVVLRQPDLLLRTAMAAVWSAILLGGTLLALSLGPGHPGVATRNQLLGVAAGMAVALVWSAPGNGAPRAFWLRRQPQTRVA